MRIHVFPSDREVAVAIAQQIAAALRDDPHLVLGLPTGRTPIHLYRELAVLYARARADFARATTFNLDEFLGLPAGHPGSYRAFMERHLFNRINVSPSCINFLDGGAADPARECRRYEEAIERAGGIDLQVLGIGTNGHIGFNEPAEHLIARTHRVTLRPETRRTNATLFGGDASRVPAEALSMGMGTILRAGSIILIATGRSKAAAVERMVNGPLTTRLPASFLQVHRDVDVMLDRWAAVKIEEVGGLRAS